MIVHIMLHQYYNLYSSGLQNVKAIFRDILLFIW